MRDEPKAVRPPLEVRELVVEAWSNVRALRQRSALAILGIVIGAASVVAMLSIGHMAGREAVKPFEQMGLDLISVQKVSASGEIREIDPAALQELLRPATGVVAATGFIVGQAGLISGPDLPAAIVAAPPALQEMSALKLAQGRFLADVDQDSLVAVIGSEVARPANMEAPAIGLGQRVQAGTYLFNVVGILAPKVQNPLAPTDYNRTILIPFGSARRSTTASAPTGALLRIAQDADQTQVAKRVEATLIADEPGSHLNIQTARQTVDAIRTQKAVHARLLAGLAGISLTVGGLGVMNVMLMGMMERRREIGLRAAIGATPRDIALMFLAEALMLASVGGVAGTIVGLAVALVVAVISGWSFSVALYALPLGAGVAMLVGLIFGVYPALKASRLDPIEALRAD